MNIPDLLNAPWAITPEKLMQMQDIYLAHLRGELPDFTAIEAELGRPLDNKSNKRRLLAFAFDEAPDSAASENDGYQIIDGTAVIPVDGVISKKMNMFSRISGGASHELLQRDFSAALEDPLVHSILLLIDSPGGEVDGTQATADLIREARGTKPVAALADGLMASAAYWLGSAADPGSVFLASDTNVLGSIGVITSHVDYSQRDSKAGIKVTDIAAGKYKAIASKHAPLSAEGRASIQELLDHAYSVFVNAVAQNRGVSEAQVLNSMADGRVFMGQKAIDAGLADGKASARQIIQQLKEKRIAAQRSSSFPGTGITPPPYPKNSMKGQSTMSEPKLTLGGTGVSTQAELDAALKAHTENAVKEAVHVAKEAAKADALEAGKKAGAEAELARVKAVEAQLMPGHEKLIAELKFDGKTTGPEAAEKVLAAERQALATRASNLRSDAPDPARSSTPDAAKEAEAAEKAKTGTATQEDANAIAAKIELHIAEQKKLGKSCSYAQALAAVTAKK